MTGSVGPLQAIERSVRRVSAGIATVGVALLALYAFATVTDVALRAAIGRPIHGFEDIASLVIPVIAASFIPYVTICRANAGVNIVGRRLGSKAAARLDLFGHLTLLAFLAVAAAQFAAFTFDARALTTMILRAPMIPSLAVVSLLLFFSVIAQALVIAAERRAASAEDVAEDG